ncbi:hypothetical protein [Micromonospora rhizosphaerae]|uniref:hypothetical protein n=1 Tax=Micromonospora rhizosphaerae TaxID=568872 RepID=UPI000AB41F14|nr:hypothetical protein [Micromonospora rhizosphaerae]
MIAGRVRPTTAGAELEEILFIARQRDRKTGELTKIAVRISCDATGGAELTVGEPPVEPLGDYRLKVLRPSSRPCALPVTVHGGPFVNRCPKWPNAGHVAPAVGRVDRGYRRGPGRPGCFALLWLPVRSAHIHSTCPRRQREVSRTRESAMSGSTSAPAFR